MYYLAKVNTVPDIITLLLHVSNGGDTSSKSALQLFLGLTYQNLIQNLHLFVGFLLAEAAISTASISNALRMHGVTF